ncbi:hypothetical protein [Kordia jejudonensis]|uniref:hypothetical protein n=1 Tax=Kordia jejudonensis TaxID=1348245 RepID=UPI000628FC10|nr:hypothetical protein [Kordia jejudonensis]
MLDKKDKQIIKKSGLFPNEFKKEIEDDLSSYLEETKKLRESTEKRKKKNDETFALLPKGFAFMIGNFEIKT